MRAVASDSIGHDTLGVAPPVRSVRRSIVFSATEKYVVQLCTAATMLVMARLLTPADTGIYLIAAGVLVMIESLRDFGVATYIVQKPDLSRTAVRTAFTVTALLSLSLAGGLYVAASSIASLFGEPKLAALLRIGTLGLLLVPFGAPAMGLLRRDLEFRTLAVLNIAAAATTTSVTITLGLCGLGPASYIWGSVAGTVLAAGLALRARPYLWLFLPSLAEWRVLAVFGIQSTAVILLNMAFDLLPRFALGRILGLEAVGLYGRAVTLCQLPDRAIVSALSPVVLPAFAARVRAQGDLRSAYLRSVTLVTAVQWPILLLVALLAEPIVAIILGDQWHAVAPLARVVALGGIALAPAFLTFPLLVAMGRVRDTLTASLISLPPSALLLVAAAPLGLDAVAATVLVAAPWQMGVAYHFVRRALGLRWRDLWRAASPSIALTIGAGLAPATVVAWHDGFDLGLAAGAVAAAGAAAGWLLAGLVTNHPLLAELLRLTGDLGLRMRRATAP